ncbi:MAG: enoyl-CoA hydratase/isomerase family protein [Desulfobacterales bacterium]|jgi:enoyl-CoA hydratase/carnithine racemase
MEDMMNKIQNLEQQCDTISAEIIGSIVKIRPKGSRLIQSAGFIWRNELTDFLDLLLKRDSIKVVIIMNIPQKINCEEYIEFYGTVPKNKLNKAAVLRMYRSVDKLILKIMESDKFFISVDSGKIYPQLFSMSLACDYRIVADNTVFKNTFLKQGMAPKGGEAYFLGKRLGHSKAFELLLSDKEVTAQEALELGIVNKVAPLSELEQMALEKAKYFAQNPADSLAGIKKLLNYSTKELTDYLEFENKTLMHILG